MAERAMYPAWKYGPDGQAEIFEKESDVPEGWKDHPSQVEATSDFVPPVFDREQDLPDVTEPVVAPPSTVTKLGGKKGKQTPVAEPSPFETSPSDMQTLEQYRREAFEDLRAAGVEISDDASEAEIDAALELLDETS